MFGTFPTSQRVQGLLRWFDPTDRITRFAPRPNRLRDKLPGILNQLDVLLIPSVWHETFSFVTREAVLAGLPVIASRMGGIPAAIDDGVNGLLLPPEDVDAWVGAMQRVVEDRELVAAFHRAQLSRHVKPMDQHAAELVQLYVRMQRERQHATYGDEGA